MVAKRMELSQIKSRLKYEICGTEELQVKGITFASNAEEGFIAIAKNKREIQSTKADVVLTCPLLCSTDKTLIYSYERLETAAVRIARMMIKEGIYEDYAKPVEYRDLIPGVMAGNNVEIGQDVFIGANTMIGNNVKIGKRVVIESNVFLGSGIWLADDVIVRSGAKIGASAFYHYWEHGLNSFAGVGSVKVGPGVEIGYNTVVQRGTFSDTKIGKSTKIGNLVDVGHDVKIGKDCKIVSQVGIAGNATIGDRVMIYGQAGINNDVVVGNDSTIYAKAAVTKNVRSGQQIAGEGQERADYLRMQAWLRNLFFRR